MKIGIDARLWNESGIGRYIRNLVSKLALLDKKNSYTLFVLERDKKTIGKLPSNWKIVVSDIIWHSLSEQFNFPSLVKKENLDLMHFPYFSVPVSYNRPFVVTIHDLIINHFPTGKASTLSIGKYGLKLIGYNFVIRRAVRKAKKIITVSDSTRDEMINLLKVPFDNIAVTSEAVDNNLIRAKPLSFAEKKYIQKLTLPPYFLYVGNAYPHKNLERLIEAFSKLSGKAKDAKLILVGKDDYFYSRLKNNVKSLNLSERVIFADSINDSQLSFLYSHAKALVLPSLMEGFGLPALEAMSKKCLVVCSDIPSLKQLCKYSAVYFDPKKSQDIALKLERVYGYTSKDTGTMIKRGLLLSKKYSWEKLAKQTLQVYESCSSL